MAPPKNWLVLKMACSAWLKIVDVRIQLAGLFLCLPLLLLLCLAMQLMFVLLVVYCGFSSIKKKEAGCSVLLAPSSVGGVAL